VLVNILNHVEKKTKNFDKNNLMIYVYLNGRLGKKRANSYNDYKINLNI
jgi:hypothetical protein